MMRGAVEFKELFEKYKDTRHVLLYGDPDVDGLISLLLMTQFVEMHDVQYNWYVNSDRFHGWSLPIDKLSGYLVLSADFGIGLQQMQTLVDNNVVILSTDHHEIGKEFVSVKSETAEGLIINNQYDFEPEEDQYLSGAGVFYELICSLYPEFKSKEREALVGVTLLSDMRQIENKKAKKYLQATYSSDTSEGYVNYLMRNTLDSDYGFGTPKFDRNYIDFTLSPFINALLRFDRTSEVVNFILGNGLVVNSMREAQKDVLGLMFERAQVTVYPNIVFIIINARNFPDVNARITSFLGYMCNDYKNSHHGKSVLGMVVDNGKVIRTSFRGRYDDIHYRTGFRNLGIDAEGHAGAFGVKNFAPTDEIWCELNDLVGDLESNHTATYNIIETSNLSITLTNQGANIARENCFVRDMYRSYIRYTGKNVKEVKHTYRMEEFSKKDDIQCRKPDSIAGGKKYKYILDADGKPITKYIEYLIDGRKVKSFGVPIEEGVILPILEKGYIQLYVRSDLD